ncbi:MAG: FAD-dependent oxidoreductase, partial [Cyanobacteria bacterium P01_F01_bin.42]
MEDTRSYDIIGLGDEVPGILALISASREYQRRTSRQPRVLLMSKSPGTEGIGGHLVRGKLAYLDRSQIPADVRAENQLDTFGDPSSLYQEFLEAADVELIALDPDRANAALQELRRNAGVDLLTGVEIDTVLTEGQEIKGIHLTRGETYLAEQFIDSTVHAELAQASGAAVAPGFSTLGLPDSELGVTLVFETQGLSASNLRQLEETYLQRLTDVNDAEAQSWLLVAAGGDRDFAEQLRLSLSDPDGQVRNLFIGEDYIDVRSRALSIAYHSFRGKTFSLAESDFILDQANIAQLSNNRLVWNSAVFNVTADEAIALAQNNARPTPEMLAEMEFIAEWFRSLGATGFQSATELYIRHAGNVTNVVDSLTAAELLDGGVDATEALGTFGYNLDIRGGIDGLLELAAAQGVNSLSFERPIFNIGIEHALLSDRPNLSVVSPASGFEGLGVSAGRIVEHNVAVGQGVGIAAATALIEDRNLADISTQEVREVLEATGQLPTIFGVSNPEVADVETFETALIENAAAQNSLPPIQENPIANSDATLLIQ